MSLPSPGPDRSGSVLAVVLALLGLSAFDLLAVPWLPGSARGFLQVAIPGCCLLVLALGLAAERGRAPWLRSLVLLLAAAPALLAASLLARGGAQGVVGVVLPGVAWWLCLLAPLVLGGLSLRVRRGVVAVVLVAWGADLALARSGLPLLPEPLQPLRAPLLDTQPSRPPPPEPVPGLVAGQLVAAGESWPGLWRAVTQPSEAVARPVVLVLGGPARPAVERITLEPAVTGLGHALETLWLHATVAPREALDLQGVAVACVHADAWPDTQAAASHAEALSGWVRGGGVLVRDAAAQPPRLEAALRGASLVDAGGRAQWGLGHGYVRDTAGPEGREPAAAALGRVGPALGLERAGTCFDASAPDPALPPGLPVGPRPSRTGLGFLVLAWAGAVLLLEGSVTSGRRALRMALPCAAVLAGVLLALPRASDLEVRAVVLELGGAGGRRIEALHLQAGEAGWTGEVAWRAPCALRRVPGAQAAARGVRAWLAPGERGWLVAETRARGLSPRPAPEAPAALWDAVGGWAWPPGPAVAGEVGWQALEGVGLEGQHLPLAAFMARPAP